MVISAWLYLSVNLVAWGAAMRADLIGYGAGETNFEGKEDAWGQRNAGCVRQPFPDVCMA